MEKALLDIVVALGKAVEQAAICKGSADMWFKYYSEAADRALTIAEERDKLQARVTELEQKYENGGNRNEDNK